MDCGANWKSKNCGHTRVTWSWKFAGIDSISDAEAMIGCELQVPLAERAELEPGWAYVSDLVGCTVFDGDHEIGQVHDVQFGAVKRRC